MSSEPKFYTVVDIARFLGISENTVYVAVRSGELTAVRVGKTIRISESAYLSWVEKMTAPKVAPGKPASKSTVVLAPAAPKVIPVLFPLPKIDIVVSNHPGMIEWLKRNGYKGPIVETTSQRELSGKCVFGMIPFTWSASAEVVYVLRVMDLSKPWQNMTAADIENSGPIIEVYKCEIIRTVTKVTEKK